MYILKIVGDRLQPSSTPQLSCLIPSLLCSCDDDYFCATVETSNYLYELGLAAFFSYYRPELVAIHLVKELLRFNENYVGFKINSLRFQTAVSLQRYITVRLPLSKTFRLFQHAQWITKCFRVHFAIGLEKSTRSFVLFFLKREMSAIFNEIEILYIFQHSFIRYENLR